MRPKDLVLLVVLLVAGSGCSARPGAGQGPNGQWGAHRFQVDGSEITVYLEPGQLKMKGSRFLAWVEDSARHLAEYYGQFPVARLRINTNTEPGRGIQNGTTYGYNGARIDLSLGRSTRMSDLTHTWVLMHELVHLTVPDVDRRHRWIEEGIATYVEPLVRDAAGGLSTRKVWSALVAGLPKGLPKPGDKGLDHTHTWGRTYWGGALFCLLADIQIRQRTHDRYGLEDALRGIVQAGGSIVRHWPLARVLHAGDAAVGVPVLTELYKRMKATPANVNLAKLWRKLGVRTANGKVTFNDQAPMARIRRAITASSALPRVSAIVPAPRYTYRFSRLSPHRGTAPRHDG